MTAALSDAQQSTAPGLRPVNTLRDMGPIADLLSVAFSGELDATGRRMVRSMRAYSRAGLLGWLAGRLFLPPAAYPQGFVWEQDGRVVGNASLLQVNGHPGRWVMANVAVHPDYRRQGIGRSMVEASVRWVRAIGGKKIILQVKSANRGANVLYAQQGFRTMTTRTIWIRYPGPPPGGSDEPPQLRQRRRDEWKDHWSMARRLHPEGVLWPYPVSASLFRPSRVLELLSIGATRHWLWREDGRTEAALTARLNLDRPGWRLILITEPGFQGTVEAPLITAALRTLRPTYTTFSLELPFGVAEAPLRELGFHAEHTLTWMSLDMNPRESREASI